MERRSGKRHRAGFSLLGIMMILAVLAILAGVITPMVFRQMMEARERATTDELVLLEAGLVAFFADTGRFPTDAEGLTALVNDPGVTHWQGPYVSYEHEEPVTQVTTDAWNLAYAYDLTPLTSPADAAAVLVASGGRNRRLDTGSVGNTWTVDGTSDDLLGLVSADRLNREKTTASSAEQELLGDAAQAYFRDHSAYPTSLGQLADDYLDQGISSDALYDQWNRNYVLAADNAAIPPTLAISSLGADGAAGGGDDVVLEINSVIPGRQASYYELAISQSVVTAQSGTDLTGDWPTDRVSFNLAAVLETDGWGKAYEEKMTTRTILSAGPDGDYLTPDDNIPPGIVPDDDAQGGTGIEYEDDSGSTNGSHCDEFSFDITNNTGAAITFTSLTLTWSSPTAYYPKVRIDGSLKVNSSNPKIASAEEVTLDSAYTLAAGATATVAVQAFVSKVKSGGSKVDMSNVDITVEFSDGSSFVFNTGPC